MRTLDKENNLAWVPSCANVPKLQALQHVQCPAQVPCLPPAPRKASLTFTVGGGSGGSVIGGVGGGGTAPGGSTAGYGNPATARVWIRNPARHCDFTGNSPLATNIQTRCVAEALVLGGDPPSVVCSGEPKLMCVFWNGKGICFNDCDREHSISSASEAEEFMGWCHVAYV
jgi:hypothetical protein